MKKKKVVIALLIGFVVVCLFAGIITALTSPDEPPGEVDISEVVIIDTDVPEPTAVPTEEPYIMPSEICVSEDLFTAVFLTMVEKEGLYGSFAITEYIDYDKKWRVEEGDNVYEASYAIDYDGCIREAQVAVVVSWDEDLAFGGTVLGAFAGSLMPDEEMIVWVQDSMMLCLSADKYTNYYVDDIERSWMFFCTDLDEYLGISLIVTGD